MPDEIVITMPDTGDSAGDTVADVVETLTELVEDSLETVETVVEELSEVIADVADPDTANTDTTSSDTESDSPLNDGMARAILAAVETILDRLPVAQPEPEMTVIAADPPSVEDDVLRIYRMECEVPPNTLKHRFNRFWFGK